MGKTALSKALARSWFGSGKALLKFDMSEYQEAHTVARLLGAPPGYLGHDEGGQLTEAVRRRPYSVVLFDEIEKAHPDIQNILLQLLEDGCLTDAAGRKADFTNTIVLLTANLGARFLAGQAAPLGFAAGQEAVFEKQAQQAVAEARSFFRPELLGRLDDTIVFRPLGPESLSAIADRLLGQLEQRAARSGYTLTHTPKVCRALAAKAASPYGARELRRQVDRAVEQALADRIASGTARPGAHYNRRLFRRRQRAADRGRHGHRLSATGHKTAPPDLSAGGAVVLPGRGTMLMKGQSSFRKYSAAMRTSPNRTAPMETANHTIRPDSAIWVKSFPGGSDHPSTK